MQLWTFNVKDKLPVIPIPLKTPDKAIPLDLNKALQAAYQSGYYHLAINYKQSPPPPQFTDKEQLWIQKQIEANN